MEVKLLKTSNLELVEAAGVEPASEIVVSQETPCSVRSAGFTPGAQNGQDAQEASPMISRLEHGPSTNRQPAVRRPLAARRQSRGGRLLS